MFSWHSSQWKRNIWVEGVSRFIKKKYLFFVWLCHFLAVASRIFSLCCGMWDRVSTARGWTGPVETESLSHWTTSSCTFKNWQIFPDCSPKRTITYPSFTLSLANYHKFLVSPEVLLSWAWLVTFTSRWCGVPSTFFLLGPIKVSGSLLNFWHSTCIWMLDNQS